MEQLARLNAKTQSFEESVHGFGGMTSADLAASLAGANPIGLFILWRRYIDDTIRDDGFIQLQKNSILKVYEADKIPKIKDMLTPLLEVALTDYIGLHVCPFCEGKQQLTIGNKIHKCRSKHCVDGRSKRKDWQRAKQLGVSSKEYSRHYKDAYKVIDRYLTEVLPEAESKAYNHVRKQSNWHDVREV